MKYPESDFRNAFAELERQETCPKHEFGDIFERGERFAVKCVHCGMSVSRRDVYELMTALPSYPKGRRA